jgi:hypothetical protein
MTNKENRGWNSKQKDKKSPSLKELRIMISMHGYCQVDCTIKQPSQGLQWKQMHEIKIFSEIINAPDLQTFLEIER